MKPAKNKSGAHQSRSQAITELKLFSSLSFKEPFSQSGNVLKWNISDCRKKSGIYIIRKNGVIVKTGTAVFCLFNAISKYLSRYKDNNKRDICEIAVLFASPEKINPEMKVLRSELKNVPISNAYNRIEPFVASKNRFSADVLDFKPVYENISGKRRCAFSKDYNGRSGVYVVRQNGVIDYVGMSIGWLYQVMYNHFSPYKKDRPGEHYRVDYSKLIEINRYEAALIEVPSFGKSVDELRKEVVSLEEWLIYVFDPQANKQKKLKEKEEEAKASLFSEPVAIPERFDFDSLAFIPDPFDTDFFSCQYRYPPSPIIFRAIDDEEFPF